jgi:Berberine and berberine like
VLFPFAKARDVLSMFADYAPAAPDDLYLDPVLGLPPGGAPGAVSLDVCYSGPQKDAERALAPIRKLGTPQADTLKTIDFVLAQKVNDSGDSRALASYMKGGFVTQVPGKLISAVVDGLKGDPRRMTLLFFQHCGGAAGRVEEKATAFAHRDALANMMAVVGWRHGVDDPKDHIEATRRYWSTLEPFTRGFYVNDMPREATSRDINENYRGNYPKLASLKRKYDPTNLFRLNANVQPTSA